MGPFSGSDQVSAVVKLSLFGRKTSKHEPENILLLVYWAAFATSGLVFDSSFCSFFRFCLYSEILIKMPSARSISCEFLNGAPNVFKVFCFNSSTFWVHMGPHFVLIIFCCVYYSKYFLSAIWSRPLNVLWVKPLCSSHLGTGWYAFVQSCQSQGT